MEEGNKQFDHLLSKVNFLGICMLHALALAHHQAAGVRMGITASVLEPLPRWITIQ
jgi:hypothetical protein